MSLPAKPGIACSWCGKVIKPNAARMRLFQSDTIRVSGVWLSHFHPECGDALLDHCEERHHAREIAA